MINVTETNVDSARRAAGSRTVTVSRPIEGISLNGDEFLLDGENKLKIFASIDEAKTYLTENGCPEQSLDGFNYHSFDADGAGEASREERLPATFDYLGHTFRPIGVLPGNSTFDSTTRKCRRIGINNYDDGKYSHAEFYKAAGRAGCGEADLFQMDGAKTVLPCQNELFEYFENRV